MTFVPTTLSWVNGGSSIALRTLTGTGGRATCLAFSPDGRTLATGGPGVPRLWNVSSGRRERALQAVARPRTAASLAFSPDGRRLAAGGEDEAVAVWDRDGRLRHRLPSHKRPVPSLAFSPDGKTLAVVEGERLVRLWDAAAGRVLRTLTASIQQDERTQVGISSVAFSPDGKTLAVAIAVVVRGNPIHDQDEIEMWQTATWRRERRFSVGGLRHNMAMAFSQNGKRLALANENTGASCGSVVIADSRTGAPRFLTEDEETPRAIAFAHNDTAVVVLGIDDVVRILDIATRRLIGTMKPGARVDAMAVSPDGRMIATSAFDTVKLRAVPNRP